jgi:hypothetical protein
MTTTNNRYRLFGAKEVEKFNRIELINMIADFYGVVEDKVLRKLHTDALHTRSTPQLRYDLWAMGRENNKTLFPR